MTANHGYIPPTRRPGELGVHSLDHCYMSVPDLKQAFHFYDCFGLKVTENANHLHVAAADDHCWIRIGEGPRKKFGFFSLSVFEEDYVPFGKRLEANGVKRLDAPAGHDPAGYWFNDPDGNLIQVKVGAKCTPDAKSIFTELSTPAGVRGAPYRSTAARTYPRRLSHVLLFTPDVDRMLAFYSNIIGLRLSDRSGDIIAFMHGIHGSDHHLIAFVKSHAPGHHHYSWDVGSVSEIGLGATYMLEKGYDRGWGLGRHVLGSNFFHYVRDPWGSYCEYSADIDYVPATHDWDAGDHPAADSLYVWGPNLPPEFIENFEA